MDYGKTKSSVRLWIYHDEAQTISEAIIAYQGTRAGEATHHHLLITGNKKGEIRGIH